MLSVVYPSNTMYVAAPAQQYYYVQSPSATTTATPTAGQWAIQGTGANAYVYASSQGPVLGSRPQVQAPTYHHQQIQQQQQQQQQRVPIPSSQVSSLVKTQPYPQTHYPPTQYVQQPQQLQQHPQIIQPRPILQRKHSSIRRASFDDPHGGVPVDADDFAPASPVLSDVTSSSGSSSASSRLNLSRSAMNHYTAPQRARRSSIVSQRLDYDRSPLSLQPQQTGMPLYSQRPPQQIQPAIQPAMTGAPYSSVPRTQPALVRPPSRPGRPISFHEEQGPIYSSYELYQPNVQRSQVPQQRPALSRRASSRSLSAVMPDLSPSVYGSGLGLGGPGAMGFGLGGRDDSKRWWKVGR